MLHKEGRDKVGEAERQGYSKHNYLPILAAMQTTCAPSHPKPRPSASGLLPSQAVIWLQYKRRLDKPTGRSMKHKRARTMLIMGSAWREVRHTMELSRSMRIVCRPSKEALRAHHSRPDHGRTSNHHAAKAITSVGAESVQSSCCCCTPGVRTR
jgi:hypothetical protein